MDFKFPNNNFNEQQLKLLKTIQLSQNNILMKCAELSERISELEKTQHDISAACQQKPEHNDDSFVDKLNLNIFLSVAATLIICVVLIIFGWHFWDIPSQTQAVNDYIYSKIVTESPAQNFP